MKYKKKKPGKKCIHGKRKYVCKDCGGKGICDHGRIKYNCEECGGSGHCPHGKVKFYCKECGGGAHGARIESVVGVGCAKPLSVRHLAIRMTKDTAYVALSICSRVKKTNVTTRRRRPLWGII